MTVTDRHDEEREVRIEAGPGTMLKAARVGRGIRVDEVASTLHISAAIIERLEADDFEGLPPDTFTRGYLKAYARLLQLDPESVLVRYPGGPSVEHRPLRVTAPVKTAPEITPGLLRGFLGGGVLAVVVGLGVWFYSLDEGDDPVADAQHDAPAVAEAPESSEVPDRARGTVDVDPEADLAGEPDGERFFTDELAGPRDAGEALDDGPDSPLSGPGADDSPRAGDDELAIGDELPGESLVDELAAVPDGDLPAGSDEVAQTDDSAEPDVAPETVAGEEELELEFSGPSWVEVYDADGERLMYGLVQDQGRERIRGTAPFSVVIGDANHVALVYQGEPVDLGQTRPGRVVRTNVPN